VQLKIGKILRVSVKFLRRGKIQKRLGYPASAKLLIIHADDLGFCSSENKASINAMENGQINSGSVMVPCPGFNEIASYSKSHPDADIGIHLTIMSEWDTAKWKPVLSAEAVPSLVDKKGYFLKSKEELMKNVRADEVENEYSAQIKLALDSGIDLTHIDSHMYSAFSNTEIIKRYKSLGKRFRLPVLLTYNLPIGSWIFRNEKVIVDQLYYARQDNFDKGLSDFYNTVLRSLRPGLSCILVHPALNDKDLQAITRGNVNHGAEWRQADHDFFTSDDCRRLIAENNIHLVTWREIRDKLYRN
jgi:hypothetical protein